MLRACFVLLGGVLTGAFLLVALMATGASAGMNQDLADCTAAKNRAAAAACTRVMKSGRLYESQKYIGYFNRGTAYRRAGDHAKALDDFSKALKLKPSFARAYEARGMVHDDLGDTDKALADLDEAVRREPERWQYLYSRAVVLRASGDRPAARRDLDAAIDLGGKATHPKLMRALLQADDGDYADARAEINRVLAKDSDNADALYARASVAFKQGRVATAEEDVDRALELRKDFAAAHGLKGQILEEHGEKSAARERFEKARDKAVDSFDGRTTRRTAKERLAALGGKTKPEKTAKSKKPRGDDVAEAVPAKASRKLDCKVFMPATGMVITAKCNE